MIDELVRFAEAKKLRELYEGKKQAEKDIGRTFNQKTIAQIGGWTQPNVSSYLNGLVELKEESCLIFSKALGVPVSAFCPRIAEKISQREMIARNPMLENIEISYVPKLNSAMLEKIRTHLKDPSFIMPLSAETTPISKSLSSSAFSYDLQDQSLSSRYEAGTTFIFDPMITPAPTNLVFVGNKNKAQDFHIREYCVTEINEDGSEVYELKAFNPAFPVLKDNYEVLGVAVAVVHLL